MNESTKNRLLFWLTVLLWFVAVVSAGFLGYYTRKGIALQWELTALGAARIKMVLCVWRVTAALAFGLAAGITLVKVLSILWQSVNARNWHIAWRCTIGLLGAWLIDYYSHYTLVHPTYYHQSLSWEIFTYNDVVYRYYPMKIVVALILLWKLARASSQKV